MKRDAAMTERLRGVIARLESQTRKGQLCWGKAGWFGASLYTD